MATPELYTVGNLSLNFGNIMGHHDGTRFTFQFNRRVSLDDEVPTEYDPQDYGFQHTFVIDNMDDERGLFQRAIVCYKDDIEKARAGQILDITATMFIPEVSTPEAHLRARVSEFGETFFFVATEFDKENEPVERGELAKLNPEQLSARQAVLYLQDSPGPHAHVLASSDEELVEVYREQAATCSIL